MKKESDNNGMTNKNIEERILDILSKNVLSTAKLAKEIGVSRYILAGYLEAMKNAGKLEFYRVGKSNVYIVAKEWRT
jgi:predicted transcriptional regulator